MGGADAKALWQPSRRGMSDCDGGTLVFELGPRQHKVVVWNRLWRNIRRGVVEIDVVLVQSDHNHCVKTDRRRVGQIISLNKGNAGNATLEEIAEASEGKQRPSALCL